MFNETHKYSINSGVLVLVDVRYFRIMFRQGHRARAITYPNGNIVD